MESLEVTRDEENTSENASWENTMENVAADGVEHANSDGSQRDQLPVPDAINRMMNNGVRFRTTKNSWNLDNESVSLKKPYSVYFTVEKPCSNQHIINAFDKIGVSCDEIFSIQQRLASNTWIVSFLTAEAKEQVMSSWNMEIAGQRVFIVDCDNRISLVKIYNAPSELPDSVIIGRLSAYGSVLSFRRDLAADNIFNGIRTARMKIEKPIPSTVRIVGEFIRLWYPGQPKSCRRCGDLGHLIKDCTSVRCFNCEKAGHRAEECEEPDTCSICRSHDHRENRCPYLMYSANVESEILEHVSSPSSYAGAAKSPRVVAPRVAFVPSSGATARQNRDTEKAREKERSEPTEKGRERSYEYHQHGRESRESREHRSHVAQDRDRERERERDRERDRDRERERLRDRSRHHRHERSRDEEYHRSEYDRERRHRSREDSSDEEETATDSSDEWETVSSKHSRRKHH